MQTLYTNARAWNLVHAHAVATRASFLLPPIIIPPCTRTREKEGPWTRLALSKALAICLPLNKLLHA